MLPKLHLSGTAKRFGVLQNKENRMILWFFDDLRTFLHHAKGDFVA